jgi:hypothetical protein
MKKKATQEGSKQVNSALRRRRNNLKASEKRTAKSADAVKFLNLFLSFFFRFPNRLHRLLLISDDGE